MSTFAQALANESRLTYTENGATAYNTTGNAVLDLFGTIGALRSADDVRKCRLFADAYAEDPLLATKALFYARDVREGLGERDTFRTILAYAANHHPEAVRPNIALIAHYGRFDDLYALMGTPLEAEMWAYVKHQLELDERAMHASKPCSLLAKWLKTPDASSKRTRELGIKTALGLGLTVYDYKRKLRALRRHLNVVETKMSARRWSEIDYAGVPSRAMRLYRNAFERHDSERFNNYLQNVAAGTERINASTLYPYDIVEPFLNRCFGWVAPRQRMSDADKAVLEAQWKALPDYVGSDTNAIVVADTSGSMFGRPIASAVGLAIYFAEHNRGAYHGLWMSFSRDSKVQRLSGETLEQKIAAIDMDHWDMDTNLEAAFMNVLDIAVRNAVPQDEMVKSIIVISDMEINECTGSWSFYDEMRARFAAAGYELPNVVFWNVDSRHDTFHTDANRKGVQLASGQSASTFKAIIEAIGLTPTEMMLKVLESERYAPITVS